MDGRTQVQLYSHMLCGASGHLPSALSQHATAMQLGA